MTSTDVRSYKDSEIFERLKKVTSFNRTDSIPLFVFIQANENKWNTFNDKVYLYDKDNKFINVTSCTTKAGNTLKRHKNPRGTWVYKTDEFYPYAYRFGLHNGKMECMRQIVPFKGYRDKDNDMIADQEGVLFEEIANTNYHTITYEDLSKSKKTSDVVGNWSEGCCVANNVSEYYKQIQFIKNTPKKMADMAILKEWGENIILA